MDEIRKVCLCKRKALTVKDENSLYTWVLESRACKFHNTIGEGMTKNTLVQTINIAKVVTLYGLYGL